MAKKIFTPLLAIVMLLLTIMAPIAKADAASSENNVEKVIQNLEIMKTDKGYTSDLTKTVTRAQFAQMLVNMSSLKNRVSAKSNYSLFSDVPKNYWAAGYIETAINQGWMTGYINGNYKPENGITLGAAVNGMLKLLGYTNSDFAGNITDAEIALYESKEMDKNINKTKNQVLTRKDCMNLIYNTLTTTNKSDKVYAEILGYALDSNGEIDYLSIVNDDLEGPILADDDWKSEIPFLLGSATYYREGSKAILNDIQEYDILYYSKDLKTIWAYDDKVTGTIQDIYPSRLAPASVKIGGTEYTLDSNAVAVEFSSLGSYDEGNMVTLLLGKDNTVVAVLGTDEVNTTVTGIVINTGEHIAEKPDDTLVNTNYATFVDAGGNEYQQDFDIKNTNFSEGDLVRVSYMDGVASVSRYKLGTVGFGDNTFSADGKKLGSYNLAANVKILDYYKGSYKNIFPERLAGLTLGGSSVCYYELNAAGAITQLILYDVTGDVYDYGVITGISDSSYGSTVYNYVLAGSAGSFSTDKYDVEKGPMGVVFDDDNSATVEAFVELNEITVKSVGTSTISDSVQKYKLADEAAIFFFDHNTYSATTLSEISNLKKYKLTAYYDKTPAEGGRVRVIIAENND